MPIAAQRIYEARTIRDGTAASDQMQCAAMADSALIHTLAVRLFYGAYRHAHRRLDVRAPSRSGASPPLAPLLLSDIPRYLTGGNVRRRVVEV